MVSSFLVRKIGTRTIKMQGSGEALLAAGLDGGDTLIFARPPQGQKCKRVPFAVPSPHGIMNT